VVVVVELEPSGALPTVPGVVVLVLVNTRSIRRRCLKHRSPASYNRSAQQTVLRSLLISLSHLPVGEYASF
jgi:hypothetical protein